MLTCYVTTLIGLFFLIIFCRLRDKRSSKKAIIYKFFASLFFIVTAVILTIQNSGLNRLAHIFIIVGLFLGLVGDICLDLKIYYKAREKETLSNKLTYVGMSSFGIGHMFYIGSLLLTNSIITKDVLIALCIGIFVTILVFVISIKLLKIDYKQFFYLSYCYCVVLVTFAVTALIALCKCGNNAFTGHLLLFIGSVFFLISDLILSTTYFSPLEAYKKEGISNPESKFMIVINHVTYYIAQYLIALSILFR